MPRQASITLENNFTKGLITEFTALNFPENAVTDCNNVEFSELGRVTRRLGVNAETNHVPRNVVSLATIDGAKVEYKWTSVGGDGTKTFVAQQIGTHIRFFEQKSGSALSSNLMPFFINLVSYSAGGSAATIAPISVQFAQGKGYLFIAHPKCDPLYVEYIPGSPGSITVKRITVQVRDFERLDDGFAIDYRPGSNINAQHYYNLVNQGWYYNAIIDGLGNEPRNTLAGWKRLRNDYPSNADIWWIYKNSMEVAAFRENANDSLPNNQVFINPSKLTLGNTPAPNGHYIYTAWDINRYAATGYNVERMTSGSERPGCIAFFAGRVFYANVSANKYGDKIYFSQIIEGEDQFGKCYQTNDPTSETTFDLVDSDGGQISIAQAARIIGLFPIADSLIVLASNGVFAIRGSDNGSFKATDFTVDFVSEIGAVSMNSVVSVDTQLVWVNYDAMYALMKDQIGISFKVENISKPTIQSVINSIPPKHKPYVKAAYNKKNRVVQFLYCDIEAQDIYRYNKILQLNVVANSFTVFTIPIQQATIVGILSIDGSQVIDDLDEVVTILGDSVVSLAFDEIVVEQEVSIPSTEIFKYTLYWPNGPTQRITYGEMNDVNYRDFRTYDGVGTSYLSFFTSGYRIRGESLRPFQSSPISVTLENYPIARQPRCTLHGLWDYEMRQTSSQELYLTRPEPDYLIRRVKLRGKGKALQLVFSSVEDHPFSVIGWATMDSLGQLP